MKVCLTSHHLLHDVYFCFKDRCGKLCKTQHLEYLLSNLDIGIHCTFKFEEMLERKMSPKSVLKDIEVGSSIINWFHIHLMHQSGADLTCSFKSRYWLYK